MFLAVSTVTDVVDGSFVVVVSAWKANSLIPIPRFCCWQTGARLETSCSEMLEALARRCPQLGALGIGFSAVSGVLPPIRFGAAMQHLDLSMVMQCAFRVDTLIKLRFAAIISSRSLMLTRKVFDPQIAIVLPFLSRLPRSALIFAHWRWRGFMSQIKV